MDNWVACATEHTQAHTLLLQKFSMWKHLILMCTPLCVRMGCQNVTQEDPDGPILSDDETDFED